MRCTHWRRVPLDLLREAQRKSAPECADSAVQCQLATHDDGEHYGLLHDVGEYGFALWLRWCGSTDVESVALPDCPAIAPGPDGEGCCLFVGHIERHTWEDTLEEISCTS
ncbi:hypothetical protein [Streptomyces sp. LaPpAH-108]|uniref:hypothetical protein n=1 Tax=Streptomyces sp. LaPpAH-108 TaxID=1155714 RepID=UPI000560585B|nr:hypothetical protein [Streptomyces sp. LaPpAH-108]